MPRLELLPAGFKPNIKEFKLGVSRYFIIDHGDNNKIVGISYYGKFELRLFHMGDEYKDKITPDMIFIAEVILD